VTFRNKLIFYGEKLLAPRPTSNQEDHPLLTVRDCLFNLFAATLHIWRPSPSATWRHAMPWWQGTHHHIPTTMRIVACQNLVLVMVVTPPHSLLTRNMWQNSCFSVTFPLGYQMDIVILTSYEGFPCLISPLVHLQISDTFIYFCLHSDSLTCPYLKASNITNEDWEWCIDRSYHINNI
jgi:hypothetical protein